MTTTAANTATPKTPDVKETVHQVAQAAQTCCQGANDAFKAYAEATQKFFGTVTKAWTAPFASMPFGQFPNPFAGQTPTANWNAEAMNSLNCCNPFDAMVKLMNGMVDANARFANECNALTVDAVRTNVRTIERLGSMMTEMNEAFAANAARVTGTTAPTAPAAATGKNSKPFTDTAREIFDEASTFLAKTSERMMKMNTDHVQSMAKLMEEVAVRPLANASKPCCKA
jgi:hypothetical protein